MNYEEFMRRMKALWIKVDSARNLNQRKRAMGQLNKFKLQEFKKGTQQRLIKEILEKK